VDTVFGWFGSLNMRRKDTADVCPAHTMKEVSGQLHVPVTIHSPPPKGKNPHHPLIRRLGGCPQSQYGILDKRKISCSWWELKPGSSSHNLVTIQMIVT